MARCPCPLTRACGATSPPWGEVIRVCCTVVGPIPLIEHAVRHVARLAVVVESAAPLARLGALPAGRGVAGAEGVHLVETRGAIARHAEAAGAARSLLHLHMRLRQLVEEARGNGRGPHPVVAPVGGEIDLRLLARAREADMREAALFLQACAAALVERALMRKQAFLPAGQEHAIEFEALGGMQRHD